MHSFSPLDASFANQDGAYPVSSLVQSQNTLYGTASQGGDAGRGTVFKLSTDGSGFSPIHVFTVTDLNAGTNPDGAFPLSGLVLAEATLFGTASAGGSGANGTIFKVNTDGSGFGTLHWFSASDPLTGVNTDGAAPAADLVLFNNALYGTASRGGASGLGTVFKLSTDGTAFATLHSFSALDSSTQTNTDGAYPLGGLVLSGNTLYGTTYRGGAAGTGTVYKINLDGSGFSVLHHNDAGSRAGLVVLTNALFGTTESGGLFGGGTVFKLGTDGTGFTNLEEFAGSPGNGPWAGLVLVSNVLYGTTYSGGALAMGSVFSLNPDGSGFNEFYSFGGTNDGAHPQAAVIVADGLFYSTSSQGGAGGDGIIFRLSPGGSNRAQLSIAAGRNNVVLSWPANATNLLQSTINLGSAWMNVTDTPAVMSGKNFVTNAISDAQRFYRLSP